MLLSFHGCYSGVFRFTMITMAVACANAMLGQAAAAMELSAVPVWDGATVSGPEEPLPNPMESPPVVQGGLTSLVGGGLESLANLASNPSGYGYFQQSLVLDRTALELELLAAQPEDFPGDQLADLSDLINGNTNTLLMSTDSTRSDFTWDLAGGGNTILSWEYWKYTQYDATRTYFVPEPSAWRWLMAALCCLCRRSVRPAAASTPPVNTNT